AGDRARARRRGHRVACHLLRLLTAGFDAVDGSSTGTEVPWMWVLLRPPRFRGAKHASGHDNRSRNRKVGFSNPRSGRGRQCNRSPPAQAPLRFAILPEATAVPCWHRSLRLISSLVARAAGTRAHGALDAASLREALRQATEERCCRR